jgi:hypothetical protein
MRSRIAIVFFLCGACLSCSWLNGPTANVPTAEKIRTEALAKARKENKEVLLIFTQVNSVWCELLDKYHADSDVAGVLSRHFVLAKVDLDETPGGEQMYVEQPPHNVPGFVILDSHGAILSDSGEGEQNIGFPNNPEQVDQYIAALTKARPKLADYELATLRQKLDELRTTVQEDQSVKGC